MTEAIKYTARTFFFFRHLSLPLALALALALTLTSLFKDGGRHGRILVTVAGRRGKIAFKL